MAVQTVFVHPIQSTLSNFNSPPTLENTHLLHLGGCAGCGGLHVLLVRSLRVIMPRALDGGLAA